MPDIQDKLMEVDANQGAVEDASYGPSILKGVGQLSAENLLYDYTISAQDTSFRVHKVLLASVSDYFMAVFRSGMTEVFKDRLHLKGVSAEGLRTLVEYLYEGKLTLTPGNVMEALQTAAHLQVIPMINLCSAFLVSEITVDNIRDMKQIAQMFNLTELQRALHVYILDNFQRFAKTKYFKTLAVSELSTYLRDDKLRCQSEYKLFKILVEWVHHSKEERVFLIATLLQHIRLPYMTREELAVIKRLSFIKKDSICRDIVERASYFREHPREHMVLGGPWTKVRSESYIISFGCNTQAMHSCVLYKGQWFPLNQALGQPRPFINAAAVVINNFLFVCGGCHLRLSNLCFCFNPITGKWSSLQPMDKPRKNFAIAAVGKKLFAIGGLCENDETTCTVEVHEVGQNTWTYTTPLPSCLADMAACSHGDKVYVAGGVDESNTHLKDFWVLDTLTGIWEAKADIIAPKHAPKMFAKNGLIYLIDLYKTEGTSAQMETYDISKDQWNAVKLEGLHFSRTFGAAMTGEWIYFVGRNDVDDGKSKEYNVVTGELKDARAYPWDVEGPICCTLKIPCKILQRKMVVE